MLTLSYTFLSPPQVVYRDSGVPNPLLNNLTAANHLSLLRYCSECEVPWPSTDADLIRCFQFAAYRAVERKILELLIDDQCLEADRIRDYCFDRIFTGTRVQRVLESESSNVTAYFCSMAQRKHRERADRRKRGSAKNPLSPSELTRDPEIGDPYGAATRHRKLDFESWLSQYCDDDGIDDLFKTRYSNLIGIKYDAPPKTQNLNHLPNTMTSLERQLRDKLEMTPAETKQFIKRLRELLNEYTKDQRHGSRQLATQGVPK